MRKWGEKGKGRGREGEGKGEGKGKEGGGKGGEGAYVKGNCGNQEVCGEGNSSER